MKRRPGLRGPAASRRTPGECPATHEAATPSPRHRHPSRVLRPFSGLRDRRSPESKGKARLPTDRGFRAVPGASTSRPPGRARRCAFRWGQGPGLPSGPPARGQGARDSGPRGGARPVVRALRLAGRPSGGGARGAVGGAQRGSTGRGRQGPGCRREPRAGRQPCADPGALHNTPPSPQVRGSPWAGRAPRRIPSKT